MSGGASPREADGPERGEVEELRQVLSAVADFLDQLATKLSDILETVMDAVKGDKLGREVGELYRSLKEHGVPDEVAIEMTREFFRRKMEAVPSIQGILQSLNFMGGGWGGWSAADRLEDILDEIEEIAMELPGDKRRRILEKVERLREEVWKGSEG